MPDTEKQRERARAAQLDREDPIVVIEIMHAALSFRRAAEKLDRLKEKFGERASWLKTASDDAASAIESLDSIKDEILARRRRRELRRKWRRVARRALAALSDKGEGGAE